jgi:acyl-CoA dehydrogenase
MSLFMIDTARDGLEHRAIDKLGTNTLPSSLIFFSDARVQPHELIGAYQGLQFPLAEAQIETECARLMNYKAARLFDTGQPYGSEANMAKWMAGRAAGMATDRAMQTLGGMGYATESHVERLWRDARLFRIAPVSEEMVLNYVAQHDLHMPRSY